MNPMQGLVERTQAELKATNEKIKAYEAQVAEATAAIETETERQLKLEQFIEKYNKMIDESADVLELLPALPVAEIRRIQGPQTAQGMAPPLRAHSVERPGFRSSAEFFGIKEIREIAIPQFRKAGQKEFTVDDVIAVLSKVPGKKLPPRPQMAGTIYAGTQGKTPLYRKAEGRGIFVLMESERAR